MAAALQTLIRRAQMLGTRTVTEDEEDFVSGFRHFRQNRSSSSQSRNKCKPLYTLSLVCLDGPNYNKVHPGIIRKMNVKNLGKRNIKISRTASFNTLLDRIQQEYRISCGFTLKKAVKDRGVEYKLIVLSAQSVHALKVECGRSKVYIVPEEELSSPTEVEDGGRQHTDQDLPSLSRPTCRAQRSSHVRTLAVIANAAADLMEESDDNDELPDPGLTDNTSARTESQVAGPSGQQRGTHRAQASNADSNTERQVAGPSGQQRGTHRAQASNADSNTERQVAGPSGQQRGTHRAQASNADSNNRTPERRQRASRGGRTTSSNRTPERRQRASRGGRTTSSSVRRRIQRPAPRPDEVQSGNEEPVNIDARNAEIDTTDDMTTPVSSQNVIDTTDDMTTPVSSQNVDLTTEPVFVPAGTPIVQFRTSTPVPQARSVMDINTSAIICLDETQTQAKDISQIGDFIPDVLPSSDTRTLSNTDALKEVLSQHRSDFISSDIENSLLMEVRRDHVLTDALSYIRVAQEDLHRPLHISFINEDGVDLGGLRREFWSIFVHQVAHSCFVSGKNGSLTFRTNYMEKKKNTFFHLGQLVALSILEDGPGLPVFSQAVTDFILEGSIISADVNDLPDRIKDSLNEMESCNSEQKVLQLYGDLSEEIMAVDFLVPVSKFHKQLIPSLKSAFVEHQVSSCKDELNQFIKGLETHQVLNLIQLKEHRTNARVLFSGLVKPLTVYSFRQLLKFKYSEGNKGLAEMTTTQRFLAFLQAASKKTNSEACVNGISVTLEDLLMWMTGARQIPAAGFHKKIDVDFNKSVTVNTCALTLTLKAIDMAPEEAIKYFTELVINSQTFTNE